MAPSRFVERSLRNSGGRDAPWCSGRAARRAGRAPRRAGRVDSQPTGPSATQPTSRNSTGIGSAESSFRGALVVVSGASAGIGEAIAARFAREGAIVVVLARREHKLREVADRIGAHAYAVDLSDPSATLAVTERILAEHGTPDVLINNAGSGQFQRIEETSLEQAHQQMALPYFAAFHLTRGFIEPMIERGSGVIVQINSPASVIPWPAAVGYSAGRWALRGFTESLRQDVHGTGVQVASVTPTRVHSDYFEANPDSRRRVPKVEIFVGSMTPAEVADAAMRAVQKRPNGDSYAPWRWALSAPLAKAFPAPFRWLFRVSGQGREKRERYSI